MFKVIISAAALSAALFTGAAQSTAMTPSPLKIQRVIAPVEMNTEEIRSARMEARLNKLEAENDALKARLAEMEERSSRFVYMPEGCRAGFSNGATVGTAATFHSNLFLYLTCRAAGG